MGIEERPRCWCNRTAAHGTDVCGWHGARDPARQVESDRRRLEAAVSAHLRWLGEVEVRWVRAGGSPRAWREAVSEGRVLEALDWLERVEAGWWDRLPDTAL